MIYIECEPRDVAADRGRARGTEERNDARDMTGRSSPLSAAAAAAAVGVD